MSVPYIANAVFGRKSSATLDDLFRGLKKHDLWGRLGWLEIKRRYRRTVIGPFWTAVSLFIFVIVLGSVGSGLLSKQTHEYLPFLVASMVVWVLLSSIITESCMLFIAGGNLIRQMRFEYSVLSYALVWRNLIVFLHNMVVYVLIVGFYAPQKFTPMVVLAIPGLLLLVINGVWVSLILGIFVLRFRDVQQLVQSIVQVSMFVTPIFWQPDNLTGIRRIVFVGLNPLYHLISIVRDPLLGEVPRLNSLIAAIIITALGWTVTLLVMRKFHKRIAYWI
jgi:ABC-type polysaccharide/polyol phosphate export permease